METVTEGANFEIERMKNVAIRPRWAWDTLAQIIAIDVIAAHGESAIPALNEITNRAGSTLIRNYALERLTRLRAPG